MIYDSEIKVVFPSEGETVQDKIELELRCWHTVWVREKKGARMIRFFKDEKTKKTRSFLIPSNLFGAMRWKASMIFRKTKGKKQESESLLKEKPKTEQGKLF